MLADAIVIDLLLTCYEGDMVRKETSCRANKNISSHIFT